MQIKQFNLIDAIAVYRIASTFQPVRQSVC